MTLWNKRISQEKRFSLKKDDDDVRNTIKQAIEKGEKFEINKYTSEEIQPSISQSRISDSLSSSKFVEIEDLKKVLLLPSKASAWGQS